MWITGGDQGFSDTIVHAVLAKTPGAPPGVKGISLFLVPKHKINDDGSIGERNDVVLGGLNHKMGQTQTTNAGELLFGDNSDGAVGELLGPVNGGLQVRTAVRPCSVR